MHGTRLALMEHCGGRPSIVQQTLIERACQLQIRIAMMDRVFAETGEQTEHDSRTYLAWSNSLVRTLRELGVNAAGGPRDPSAVLADIHARYAAPIVPAV